MVDSARPQRVVVNQRADIRLGCAGAAPALIGGEVRVNERAAATVWDPFGGGTAEGLMRLLAPATRLRKAWSTSGGQRQPV
jgi:hypothetical protein